MENMNKLLQENKDGWNSRVPIHISSEFYDVAGFKSGGCALKAPELSLCGNVTGLDLLHLQCHFGLDTLSWARRGAIVTGLDFSEVAIVTANTLSKECGISATFVLSDIYRMDDALNGKKFDIIFTSYGTIGWIPDLNKWADLIAMHLKTGGKFVIVDFHPHLLMYDFDRKTISYPYFSHIEPISETHSGTYADPDNPIVMKEHSWSHPISEIVQSLIKAKLHIEDFCEWDYSPYPCFSNLEIVEPGKWQFRLGAYTIPHLYGIVAKKN